MKNNIVQILVCTFLAFGIVSCGNNTASKEKEAAEEISTETSTGVGSLVDAAKELEKAAQGVKGENGEVVEPVDFRELKALLPASVNGMTLSNPSGEKGGMMNIKVSSAKGEYKNNDSKIELTILDLGGMTGAVSMMAAWSMMDMDKEDDNGYEKTGTYNGHKSHEKYNTKNKDGELAVLVGNRFIVTADGNNVEMSAIKKAIDAVNLQKLQSIK